MAKTNDNVYSFVLTNLITEANSVKSFSIWCECYDLAIEWYNAVKERQDYCQMERVSRLLHRIRIGLQATIKPEYLSPHTPIVIQVSQKGKLVYSEELYLLDDYLKASNLLKDAYIGASIIVKERLKGLVIYTLT